MLSRLFRKPGAAPKPTVPEGLRVYAVGDIHGRADLLETMAGLVQNDLESRPVAAARTIFVGDYIDRGPASAGVIQRLASADFPTPIVALRGNHDAIFGQFLRGDVDLDGYFQIGGEATLASYGIDPDGFARLNQQQRAEALVSGVPATHRTFLETLAFSDAVGDYFFCHAGVRPGVPLERQSEHDLLWIREEFLHSDADFGKFVVHGHTPFRRPLVRDNAIDVDTKAFASGVLTALVLEGTERRFLQTG